MTTAARILKTPEVIGLLRINRKTFWRWRRAGVFPAGHVIGLRDLCWTEAEVSAWLKTRRARPLEGDLAAYHAAFPRKKKAEPAGDPS